MDGRKSILPKTSKLLFNEIMMNKTNLKKRYDFVHKLCDYTNWTKVIFMNSPGCISIIIIVVVLTGCSVVDYAAGEKGVDVSFVHPGITKVEVEAILGKPVRSWTSPTGVFYCTYEYDSGRPPIPSEAGAMLFMDIATLGLWEVFWPSIKKDISFDNIARTTATVLVSYDHQDIILGVFGEFDELPPDGRSPIPKSIQNAPHFTD